MIENNASCKGKGFAIAAGAWSRGVHWKSSDDHSLLIGVGMVLLVVGCYRCRPESGGKMGAPQWPRGALHEVAESSGTSQFHNKISHIDWQFASL